jgi:hypothetical protein
MKNSFGIFMLQKQLEFQGGVDANKQNPPMAETRDRGSENSMLMLVLMLTHVKVPHP